MIPTVDASRMTMGVVDQASGTARTMPGKSPKPVDSPEETKLKKAAGDFESILLSSMWKAMKNTFGASDSDSTDAAHGTLEDWGIEIMSGAVGKAGGLGIGNMIIKHLEPTLEKEKQDPAPSAKLSSLRD